MNASPTTLSEPATGSPALGHNGLFRLLGTPRWKRMENLSMLGVLKRDKGTQLTLQVKLQHGYFEVLAVLERGTSTMPDADWARVQLRLAEQGVRMAPLVSSSDGASWYAAGRFPNSDRKRNEPLLGALPVVIAKEESDRTGGLRLSSALNMAGKNS